MILHNPFLTLEISSQILQAVLACPMFIDDNASEAGQE